jgi:HEPN domain-containing protein
MKTDIENWDKQAKRDFEKAEYLLKNGYLDGAAFYCQQAVEKKLKYQIILKRKESPGPIHSLIKLGKLAEVPEKFHNFLKRLTSEYYLSRYPDITEEAPYELYEKTQVEGFINTTRELFEWLDTQTKK